MNEPHVRVKSSHTRVVIHVPNANGRVVAATGEQIRVYLHQTFDDIRVSAQCFYVEVAREVPNDDAVVWGARCEHAFF